MKDDRYVPALAYRWLTPFYDPVISWTTRETAFKTALLDQVALQPSQRLLDLACGTATLTVAAKTRWGNSDIQGVDGDPQILGLARRKVASAGVDVALKHAMSSTLPYANGTLDAVMSSLFFHHLTRAAKIESFLEIRRVLKPGGWLHIADWGRAGNPLMRGLFLVVQLLDGFETTTDNVRGLIPSFLAQAGFVDVAERRRFATPLGTISLYAARSPTGAVTPERVR